MKKESGPTQSVSSGLRAIGNTLFEKAFARIDSPTDNPEKDLHFLRTTIKQLRALLRILKPFIGKSAFKRQNARLRGAGRGLGALRDETVSRETLTDLGSRTRSTPLKQSIKAALKSIPARNHSPMPGRFKETRIILKLAHADFKKLPLKKGEWAMIRAGLKRVYKDVRNRMGTVVTAQTDEAFHRWRIRVKNLYFALQWLEPLWPRLLGPKVRELQKLQRLLGDDHDLVVLKKRLGNSVEAAGGTANVGRLLKNLDQRNRKMRHAAERLGKKLFRQTSSRFIGQMERSRAA